MIIVLQHGSTEAEVAEVLAALERRGMAGRLVQTGDKPVVHIIRGRTRRARKLLALEQVEAVVPTSGPRVRRQGWRFFPYHFAAWSALGVALLGVVVYLAGHHPPGIGQPIDHQHPPLSLEQPWYLRAPLAFVGLFPDGLQWLGLTALVLLVPLLLYLPALDRGAHEQRRLSWLRLLVALAVVAALIMASLPGVDP